MFRKKNNQPSIVQITSTSEDHLLFIFGLGADGKVYVWNSMLCEWGLNKVSVQEQANAEATKN